MSIEDYLTTQLQDGEEIISVVRQHAARVVPPVMLAAIIFLTDFFLLSWWFRHHLYGVAGFVLLLGIALSIGIRSLYLWRHNVFSVTNKRVIEIDQRGLFERHVSEATLDKIQDVRYTVKGVWATVLSYGTVIIQTAGATATIDAEGIHRPVQLQRLIIETQQASQKAQAPSAAPHIVDIRHVPRHG